MTTRQHRFPLILAAAIITTAALILVLPEGLARQIPVFLLLWIWPAFAWSLILRGHAIVKFLLGAGLALFLNSQMLLVLSYLPGNPSATLVLVFAVVIALIPISIRLVRPLESPHDSNNQGVRWQLLSIVLFISLIFRIVNMGYKELQGDEGIIMVRAAAALTGDRAELFLHQKGPMEILLPMATWLQTGLIEDFWARLPFVWAGLLVVMALYWLGRQWFNESVGLLAALLFAVNGFGIAFSRIVQYQSLVMLFGVLALIEAWRYLEIGRRGDLILCLVFTGASLLAHYDAVLVLPAIAWIIVRRLRNEQHHDIRAWLIAILLGLAIIAVFYVPYVLSPTFEKTLNYLFSDRVGTSAPGSIVGGAAAQVWQMSTFYNSLWYILGLLIMILIGLWALVKERVQFAAVLYFAVPFIFYTFIVEDPRTHVYTFFPGAVMLAAVGVDASWDWLTKNHNSLISYSAVSFFALWLVVVAIYPYLMFVSTSPERQRTWSVNRPWPYLYPVTWEEPPQYGLFGFPHQAGWRAVSGLIAPDELPYASNEEEEITNWYMAQAARTHCGDFRSFVLAANAQDEIPFDTVWAADADHQTAVLVNGEDSLLIYRNGDTDEPDTFEVVDSRRWLSAEDIAPVFRGSEHEVDVILGDRARLLGYDLDTSEAKPGGQLIVTLYWEALAPMELNNQVFVHLFDGEMRAQHDGAPECNIVPTTRWEPGQYITDPHIVDLPGDIPEGSIPLWVGMYDLLTGINLPPEGTEDGRIYLQDIQIKSE